VRNGEEINWRWQIITWVAADREMQREYKIQQGFISHQQHLLSGNKERMTTMSTHSMVSSLLVLV